MYYEKFIAQSVDVKRLTFMTTASVSVRDVAISGILKIK